MIEKEDYIGALDYLNKHEHVFENKVERSWYRGLCLNKLGQVHTGGELMRIALLNHYQPAVTQLVEVARYHQLHMDFGTAQNLYREAMGHKGVKDSSALQKAIGECVYGNIFGVQDQEFKVVNAGRVINSPYSEYGLVCFPNVKNKAAIISRRPRDTRAYEKAHGKLLWEDDFCEDIYFVSGLDRFWWARDLGPARLNTDGNDGILDIVQKGQKIYLYKDKAGGDIYESNLTGKHWSRPSRVFRINSLALDCSFSVSPHGSEALLVSNRKGGQGGKDIWYTRLDRHKRWTKPINLGSAINTPYDEESPCFSPDGSYIYFASKGHNSMGGYDIFRSYRLADGTWSEPQNLGMPVNSGGDDLFPEFHPKSDNFYFTSNRPNGFGGYDIYTASPEIPPVENAMNR